MTIGSLLLGLALLILVGLFVARPLMTPAPRRRPVITDRQALLAQKEALLTEIQLLDFDYETGKVPEAEYQRKREDFLVQAETVYRQLDQLDEGETPIEEVPEAEVSDTIADHDADIEAAIARLRSQSARPATEAHEVATPASRNGGVNFCPQCGQPTDPEDKFCANCGEKILHTQQA